MISKVGAVIVITAMVAGAYLLLLVVMPILNTFAAAANATMDATSNMSLYPGTSEALIASPWVLFWVPGVLGMAAIFIVLRGE